jgi:arginase family enzyme
LENGNFPLHLNLDMDCADPQFVPGAGTRARGGLNYN